MDANTTSNRIEMNTLRWNPISITVFVVMIGVTLWLFYLKLVTVPLFIVLVVASIFSTMSIHIADQWEKAVVLQERDKIADDLQRILDQNTNPWGITCQTVGIKDIIIPQTLADAMSKEAQAERERRARVILGTAETEIALKFAKASEQYINNPVALHLRGMNMLFEGLKEKGSMVIVPSSALDSMNLGAIGGLISLAKAKDQDLPNTTA
jgi:hypothetical protein